MKIFKPAPMFNYIINNKNKSNYNNIYSLNHQTDKNSDY